MYKTQLERKKANLSNLQERTQKIVLRREIKKVVKEQILFERKRQLNEGIWDTVLDFGQTALDVIGSFPGLEMVDGANAAIHFTRALGGDSAHFLYGLVSLISIIPVAGDAIMKPFEYLVRLARLFGEESAIARNAGRIASYIGSNSQTISRTLTSGQNFVRNNRRDIEKAINKAHTEAQNRNRSRVRTEDADPTEPAEPETTGNTIIDSIVNFILNNDTLREIFADSSIVDGIKNAYDQLASMFDRVVEAFTGVSSHDEEELTAAGQQVQTEALKRLNESKNERVSLKVLF